MVVDSPGNRHILGWSLLVAISSDIVYNNSSITLGWLWLVVDSTNQLKMFRSVDSNECGVVFMICPVVQVSSGDVSKEVQG